MYKKTAAIFLICMSLVMNIISISVCAESYSIFTYTVSNNEVTITRVSNVDEIEIPYEINGYPVTAIGNSAFSRNSVSSVKIPSSVTKINMGAFANCTNLVEVIVPNSVTEIGSGAFLNCTSLQGVVLSGNMSEIPQNAFSGCTALETIVIPQNIKQIQAGAFNNCTSLTTVVYEGTEEDWENTSVRPSNNGALTSAEVIYVESFSEGFCGESLRWHLDENGVMTIGNNGDMENWDSAENTPWYFIRKTIRKVVVEDDVESIGDYAFCDCGNLEALQLGKSVTTIGKNAFRDCKSLYTVYIPAAMAEIESAAFSGCEVIREVKYSYGENEWNEIAWNDDNDCLKNCTVEYYYGRSGECGENLVWSLDGDGVMEISGSGEMAQWNSAEDVPWHELREEITEIVFSDDVTSIGNYAFSECLSLTKLNIGISITTIGERAFADCNNLNTVSVPGSLKEVKNAAFTGCPSIQNVNYEYGEDKWNYINWNDENGDIKDKEIQFLQGRSGLCGENLEWNLGDEGVLEISGNGEMTNWNSPEEVPWYAFREEIVCIYVNAESIGSYAFYGCSNLTDTHLWENITTIGNDAFNGCSKLTEMSIPSFVKNIADRTFYRCTNLRTYEGGRIESIGEEAFFGCSNLISAELSGGLNSIGKEAFGECKSLTSVKIPNSVKSIEDGAFNGCSALVTVTLNLGLKEIGNNTFSGCAKLKNISLPETLESIGNCAFSCCYELKTVNLPVSVKEIGEGAFELSNVSEFNVNKENENYSSIEGNLFNKDGSILLAYALAREETAYTVLESVKLISNGAFRGSQHLESIIIPDNVAEIGESAFADCENLESAIVGNGVGEIKNYTFANCENLADVRLGDGITAIEENAFRGSGIKEIIVPEKVTIIGNEAFADCRKLEKITLSDSLEEIGERAFSGCESLIAITIPDKVTNLGARAFEACTGMISAIIGDSVTELNDSMFEHCVSLTNVTLPEGLNRIDNSFNTCDNLKIAYYNGTVTGWNQIEKNGYMPRIRRLICWVTFVDNDGNFLYKAKNLMTDDQGIAASIIPSGCYENLYLDKELTQKYKLDTPVTKNITLYVDKNMAMGTKTLVSDKDEIVDHRTLFTIKGMKLEEGSRVILSLYDNGKFMGFHNAVYFEGDIVFKTDCEYDKVKVMVWDEKKGFKPVTVAEEIEKVN